MPDPTTVSSQIDDRLVVRLMLAFFLFDHLYPEDSSLEWIWPHMYRDHSRLLGEVGTKLGLHADEIEVIIQNLYETMLTHAGKLLDNVDDLYAWSCGVMRHKAADVFRQRRRRGAHSLDDLPAEPMDTHMSESAFLAEEEECRESLGAMLGKLKGTDRENAELWRRHRRGDESCESLAEEKGLTVHAVECRITRGHQAIQDHNEEARPR